MAIKLTTQGRPFIPDVLFPTDEGIVNNRDLPESDRVEADITLASVGQKSEYLGSYTVGNKKAMLAGADLKQYAVLQYDKCIRKHVTALRGLDEFGITNGRTLIEHETTPELNDLIQDLFFKINGMHSDDVGAGGDAGEFTPGESQASE